MSPPDPDTACDPCLRRSWLIARLSGHLDRAGERREEALALPEPELIAALGGRDRPALAEETAAFSAAGTRARCAAAGLHAVCRCAEGYPPPLRELASAPSVIYAAGLPLTAQADVARVAIVGSRRASPYALELAGSLARSLAACAVTVVSGMAFGVDGAAHEGALAAGGRTVAVLPGPAERPYPRAHAALHRRLLAGGGVISEIPPGARVGRWAFSARNRIIAALGQATVVVEAGERSGSLLTARIARRLGRPVGAVPGRVGTPLAAGPHGLIRSGAVLVRDASDVLEMLGPRVGERDLRAAERGRALADLEPEARKLLAALARSEDPMVAAGEAGLAMQEVLAALAELELGGHVVRRPGGSYGVVP